MRLRSRRPSIHGQLTTRLSQRLGQRPILCDTVGRTNSPFRHIFRRNVSGWRAALAALIVHARKYTPPQSILSISIHPLPPNAAAERGDVTATFQRRDDATQRRPSQSPSRLTNSLPRRGILHEPSRIILADAPDAEMAHRVEGRVSAPYWHLTAHTLIDGRARLAARIDRC